MVGIVTSIALALQFSIPEFVLDCENAIPVQRTYSDLMRHYSCGRGPGPGLLSEDGRIWIDRAFM
jgi:hypothetical protein